jgi:ABC-2 type transport system ATP-binding protein
VGRDYIQRVVEAAVRLEDVRQVFHTSTGFWRRAKRDVTALDGVSFSAEAGQLLGLLGPNGAGKTTSVKILTTLLIPTGGSASVLGVDVVQGAQALRRRIGFVLGGERGLYYRLTGRENLRYFGELYYVDPGRLNGRVDELLALVNLTDRADERVMTYSRGMKQRLHIARALIHQPEILFLDEPTQGLDPVAARELRRLVKSLQARGVTILLTTHNMLEADELCDNIVVINHGRVVAEGTPASLKRGVDDVSVVELEVNGATPAEVTTLTALAEVDSVVLEERQAGQLLRVQTRIGARAVPALVNCLDGVTIARIDVRDATLEDAYVRLVSDEVSTLAGWASRGRRPSCTSG